MNLPQISFLLFTLFLFAYLWLQKAGNNRGNSYKLPPGTSGWPLIGETLGYFSNLRSGNLEKFVTYRRNKHSTAIFRTSLVGQPMAVFCNADGHKFLFSNEAKYFKQWWPTTVDKLFPKSNNKPNAEHTKTLRRLLTCILRRDVLRQFVGKMDAVMNQHLQTLSDEVKVGDFAKKYIFKLACVTFLGIDDQGRVDELEKAIREIGLGLHSVPLDFPGTVLRHAINASLQMRNEFEEMIRRRKIAVLDQCSGKDFISRMLQSKDDDGQNIPDADMACILVGLLQGSYSTVHTTITNTMVYLSQNPDVYNLVLEEQKQIADGKYQKDKLSAEDLGKMTYSWNVVSEVLRLKPPIPGTFKEATKDFKYAGYSIPKGWKIHWIAQATQMNPKYFPSPEKFDPSRFEGDGPASYTFMAFGAGAHMCPGMEYARLAILVFLHNIVTRFRWERLIPDEQVLHYPFPSPACGLPVKLYAHEET